MYLLIWVVPAIGPNVFQTVFGTYLHLSCNGSHQRRPTPPPSWSQSLGTACSSRSRSKAVYHVRSTSQCCVTISKQPSKIKSDVRQKFLIMQFFFKDITLSYLCCHDEAGGGGVDGDITSHQSNILELLIHFPVLLVGEGLDGAGKDHSLFLSEGQCNGISTEGEQRVNQVRSLILHYHSQWITTGSRSKKYFHWKC